MTRRRPWLSIGWDGCSDQPHMVRDRRLVRQVRLQAWPEMLTTVITAMVAAPVVVAALLAKPRLITSPSWPDLLGCGLSPHPAVPELVAELGLRRALIRLPMEDPAGRHRALQQIASLPHLRWLVVFPQSRRAVLAPPRWAREVAAIARDLPPQVEAVQLGNAVNRLKWGCVTLCEYLDLLDHTVPALRRVRPDLLIAGSSVIDFEPVATVRTLINRHRFRLDAVSALLYVDRRGGPKNRQYHLFDAAAKMALVAACVTAAPRHGKRLWLTEVNWPLQGHGPWSPTSEAECVDEAAAGSHLEAYCRTAAASGVVERIYPWQLMARGYGLVDPCDLRRRPAFLALKRLLGEPMLPPARSGVSAGSAPALR